MLNRLKQFLSLSSNERKQAEEKLRQSEERFKLIFHRTPIPTCVVTLKDGRFVDANNSFLNLVGVERGSLIGRASVELGYWSDGRAREDFVKELMEQGSLQNLKVTFQNTPTDNRNTLAYYEIIIIEDQPHVLAMFYDETERIRAEEELLKSEQRFRKVLDNLGEGVAVQDNEWRYTYANPAAHAIVGWEVGTLLGAHEDEIVAPTSRLQVEQHDTFRHQGGISSYECDLIRPNGEIRTVIATGVPRLDEQGELAETFVTFTDITERKYVESKLRQRADQEEALRATLIDISSELDMPKLLQIILERAVRLSDTDMGEVAIFDEESSELVIVASYGLTKDFVGIRMAFGEGTMGQAIARREAFIVDDYQKWEGISKQYCDESFHASLAMPLFFGDRLLGAIALGYLSDRKFTEEDMQWLNPYATQVAIAIENARLYKAEQEKRREAETLRKSLASVVTLFDLNEIVERILDQIKLVIPYDTASVWRVEGDWLALIVGRDLPPEFPLDLKMLIDDDANEARQLLIQGEIPFILNNNVQEELSSFKGSHSYINSWLVVPLKKRGKIIGQIALDGKRKRQFSEHHAELAISFADQVAIALENASLYSEIQQELAERKRAEQALRTNEEKIQELNASLENRVEDRTAQLNVANQNLHQEKIRLELYSRQRELMGTMTDLLQASLTTEEASGIVSRYMQLLFPNRDGALYLLNTSGSLEPTAIWGEQKSLDTVFGMNDCWALRRGKSYRFGSGSPNPPCAHVGKEITQCALCIPLAAQGESMGSLHILTESIGEGGLIDDEEQGFVETITDSIALAFSNVRLRERLRIQSIRDGLTGLFNRRYLDETLPREIHRAERSKTPISVLMFDIDNFKKFNDTYGHDAGDNVLKRIAETVLSNIRPSDIACRYGGEEFTIVLPDTALDVAHLRGETLREAASKMSIHHNGKNLGTVTISLGIATYPQHGRTRDVLIKSADEASYQAKQTGKNRVVVAQ